MDQKNTLLKQWIGTGSINVFGLPFSGKDTVGVRLAETLGAKFLSSGLILRAAEKEDSTLAKVISAGDLAPTETFRSIILPYFSRAELTNYPLVLSSVGRWSGEEGPVMEAAQAGGHEIKATILLNISEEEARKRWEVAKELGDRGERSDDRERSVLDNRIAEFVQKTMPVINTYHQMGILIPIKAMGTRDEVFAEVIDELAKFATQNN